MGIPKSASVLAGSKIEIPESRYKADIDLLDKYISFSSEIVRLALASIGGIGFIIGHIFKDGKLPQIKYDGIFNWSTLSSLFFLALSLLFALAHRYYASDGIYYHLRAIKRLILLENNSIDIQKIDQAKVDVLKDEYVRNKNFAVSGVLLMIASVMLFLGVTAAGLSIAMVLIGGMISS